MGGERSKRRQQGNRNAGIFTRVDAFAVGLYYPADFNGRRFCSDAVSAMGVLALIVVNFRLGGFHDDETITTDFDHLNHNRSRGSFSWLSVNQFFQARLFQVGFLEKR